MQIVATHESGPGFRITWTAHADQKLAKMREHGISMRCMARAFGLSRSVITARARALGLEIPTRPAPVAQKASLLPDWGRDPLPAGHDLTWGLITQGTCLEGSCYTPPEPVRTRKPRQKCATSN